MSDEHRQRELPIARVEEADAAYVDAIKDCRLAPAMERFLVWIVAHGRRDRGCLVVRSLSQRNWAAELGVALSTVSTTLKVLSDSRLVVKADGELRLVLPHLVAVAEEARARAAPDRLYEGFDAAEALARVRPCSAVFGPVRPRSARRARSVKRTINTPVSVDAQEEESATETGRTGATERAERGRTRPNGPNGPNGANGGAGRLKLDPAWQALQGRHFRPALDRRALGAAFRAAAGAGLVGDDYAARLRFVATAIDLAGDPAIRSPAVVLRSRVERQSCWRQSDAALAQAKRFLRGDWRTAHHSPLTTHPREVSQ